MGASFYAIKSKPEGRMGSSEWPKLGFISDAGARLHAEVASDEVQDALLSEFDRLGEEEVRLRLQFHIYDEQTIQRAHDWLADREYSQFGDDIRTVRTYARKTNEVARDSIKLAETAKQLAFEADAAAREAKEVARAANQAANLAAVQLRESAKLTGLALIVAVVALAISVGVVVFH
jgi:hypothetical protein